MTYEWECPNCESVHSIDPKYYEAHGLTGTVQCPKCALWANLSRLSQHGFVRKKEEAAK